MFRRTILLTLPFCLLQSAFAFEEDLQFVKGLTEEGFPKLARIVLDRTLEFFPAASAAAPELRIRILIAEKKFQKAGAAIISLMESPPAEGCPKGGVGLWLFLAETACAARQLPAAEAAYQNYFKNLTEATDATGQAAFNYGELLEERGDDEAAKKIYEQTLTLSDSRPVKAKLAALLIESDPARSLKLAEEVQLGGLDLWFGQAVVIWSQIMIDRSEWNEAQAVLETQLELLKPISDSGPTSMVPIAGARYLLGLCYEHEGKNAEALHQFYNVYAKQGDSKWGPKAQEKATALIAYFEGQGKTVKIDLGANLAKMEESTFRVARRLFFDRQYAEAIPFYLDALNEFPEGSESISALRELTLSHIHLDDELGAQTVGLYLSERFTEDPKAGDALLAAGKTALDTKEENLAWWMYDRYIESFPTHPRAPAVLYSLAGLRKEESYLDRIVENYPDSSYHARALGRLAWNAFEAKDYATAADRFAPYVDTETDPQKQTRARFAFAESWRNLAQQNPFLRPGSVGDVAPPAHSESLGRASLSERAAAAWKNALEIFQTLEKSLEEAANSYGVSKETLEFNQPFHEKAVYYQAVCFVQRGELDEAVSICNRFLETFPTSGILEQVRFTQGKTLIESGRFAEALAAFEPFGDEPDHEFAEPVYYYRGVAQYETGAYEQSFQTLGKLLTEWPASAFTYEAMFVQGRAYVAADLRDEAIRVFGDILNFASDDLLIHRASLELGRAQIDPAEKLASFQRVALLADPDNEAHAALIADALFESLPLYLELARTNDLLTDSARLMSEFPNLGKTKEIALLKMKAKQQLEETVNEQE
ncbi:MAG: tetratricopeptide repeat protein [Victivallales bacterium]|nr:tetratricopeptide repeat protein [Victivallales bacterium]